MKQWRDEKRAKYMERLIEGYAKSTENGRSTRCPLCHLGKAVWRCKDCGDRRVLCVLCFRDRHLMNLFHRVEKWNGRYFQRGALWQVGVKIYVGHQGMPCPQSADSLTDIRGFDGKSNTAQRSSDIGLSTTIDVEHFMKEAGSLQTQFQTDTPGLIQEIEMVFKIPEADLDHRQRQIVAALRQQFGEKEVNLICQWTQTVARAEREADELQAYANQQLADQETVQKAEGWTSDPLLTDIPLLDQLADDAEEWEDEEGSQKGSIPRFMPMAPTRNGSGNDFLTIVHSNGFHSLPIVWCDCEGGSSDRDLQLLDMHLYPATYDNPKTLFTFACLDNHRFENLECKSSHYEYHQKLKRLTCPEYPDRAPHRYNELRRVTRQWRNLKYRKWFWIMGDQQAKRGEMALFCAACPQVGVNLPPDWEADYMANP